MKGLTKPLLEVDDIHVSYGHIDILHGVCMKIYETQCVSLVGLNGSGKSTLLKTISGFLRPRIGTILFKGERIDNLQPWQISRMGIVYVPEGRKIFARLTVKENLLLGCYLKEKRAEVSKFLKKVYEIFPLLEERSNQEAGTLSGGEQQMLALGMGLMADPKLIMLDEVALGLAPKVRLELYEKIAEIKHLGITMLIVDENVKRVVEISDLTYVLQSGQITLCGEPKNIIEKEEFLKGYFGV